MVKPVTELEFTVLASLVLLFWGVRSLYSFALR